MKKINFLLAALVAVFMTSCMFKVEATVDVTVLKNGEPQKGVQVYRFNDTSYSYKSNAADAQMTNNKGVAHFDLRSPDDLDPSSLGAVERAMFYFATFNENDERTGLVEVGVATGDKKQVTIEIQ